MRALNLTMLVFSRLYQNRWRVLASSLGVALAVCSFVLARFLGVAGDSTLDEAITRTQGQAATVAVEVQGTTPAMLAQIDKLGQTLRETLDRPVTAVFYLPDLTCGGVESSPPPVLVRGSLDPLGGPTETMIANSLVPQGISYGAEPAFSRFCDPFPFQVTVVDDLEQNAAADLLGIQQQSLLLFETAATSRLRAEAASVAFVAVVDPTVAENALASMRSLTRVWISGLSMPQQPTAEVRRVDNSGDFVATQRALSIILTVVGLLGLVAGVTGVVTTQLAGLPLKLRYFALCRAIGASQRDIWWLAFVEGVTVVLGGVIIGLAVVGLILALAGTSIANAIGATSLTWTLRPFVQVLAICLPVALAAGFLPASKARSGVLRATRDL